MKKRQRYKFNNIENRKFAKISKINGSRARQYKIDEKINERIQE